MLFIYRNQENEKDYAYCADCGAFSPAREIRDDENAEVHDVCSKCDSDNITIQFAD